MKRSAETTKESFKRIWNKASMIFFSFLFVMGMVIGVKDTYVVPYLTDELGASSQLISEKNAECNDGGLHFFHASFVGVMVFVGSVSSLMGNLTAKKVLKHVGELNMLYIGIIVECSRLLTWAFVK